MSFPIPLSPTIMVALSHVWWHQRFGACPCGAVLDVRIERERLECGRCGREIRAR